ncbi:TPA: tail fiber assembly protein [Citrobacter youngae]|nr:tail fiber assembly protein [Citrobacter youngae]HEF0072760.1 tail fiber assembly protein [Citrobacter youngae]
MTLTFDENGLATQAGEIRVYYYEPSTGEYRGWSDEYINVGVSMPGHSTTIDPGEESPGFVAVFNGTGWEQQPDNRGVTVYSTADRATTVINYIGEIRSGFTTVAPSTQYDKWDGSKWVADTDAQRKAAIADAEKQRSHLLASADKVMLDWRTELMLGEISDANKAKLSAWLAYKNEVKAVNVTTDPGHVNWPAPPEM